MTGKSRKDLEALLAEAEQQGFRRVDTKKGRRYLAPDGVNAVTVHLTESDSRAVANTLARLRRFGFVERDRD